MISNATSTVLLDLAAGFAFVIWIWGFSAIWWSLMDKILTFAFDEIDLYYERKYPDA